MAAIQLYPSTNAPHIGVPVNPANPTTNSAMPRYAPIRLGCGAICAIHGDMSETIAPEKKPYNPAKTRIAALEVMAIQHRRRIDVHNPEMKRRVKLPKRSAANPGQIRPKMDAALRMGRVYEASCGDMPCATA